MESPGKPPKLRVLASLRGQGQMLDVHSSSLAPSRGRWETWPRKERPSEERSLAKPVAHCRMVMVC